MRRHLLIAVMFGAISGAQAADMPDNLRGSIPPTLSTSSVNWQGYYIGGQGGYGSADENFTGSKMFTDPLFRAMYAPNSSLLAATPSLADRFR
jgi:opacity protein-like surface antigen